MPVEEIYKSIGSLEANVKNLKDGQDTLFEKQEILGNKMIKKIDALHGDLNKIKVTNAKKAGAMGIVGAIATLGIIEGIRYWMRNLNV